MADGHRAIQKVYDAFFKAGRDREAGTVKERFLEALKGQGVDFTKTSSARLAVVLRELAKNPDLKFSVDKSGHLTFYR